jgi:hypothetical protein
LEAITVIGSMKVYVSPPGRGAGWKTDFHTHRVVPGRGLEDFLATSNDVDSRPIVLQRLCHHESDA